MLSTKTIMDVESIRKDFPILQRKVHGRPLVYFDNAATSQKPKQVIDAMDDYYKNSNANIHRSIHQIGEEATQMYEQAHEKVADFTLILPLIPDAEGEEMKETLGATKTEGGVKAETKITDKSFFGLDVGGGVQIILGIHAHIKIGLEGN